MPNGDQSNSNGRHLSAIREVNEWLTGLPGKKRRLSESELRNYSARNAVAGWRLSIMLRQGYRQIDVLVDKEFPRKEPRIAIVDAPPFLTVPHIERDGVLCLLPGTAEANPFEPVNVVRLLLNCAVDLLEEVLSGGRQDDFLTEFQSYWQWDCSLQVPSIHSLATPEGPTRPLRLRRGREGYLVAENDEELIRWLDNLLQRPKERTTETAALFWLNEPLVPSNYPQSVEDLRRIADTCGGAALLQELIDQQPEGFVVVLGAKSSNGPCLGGILVSPTTDISSPGKRALKGLTNGFRPGKVPKSIRMARFVSNSTLVRTIAARVDPLWIHGRGQDQRVEFLRNKTVAILGCGSVGAAVAVALAKTGVGRLILVDPELLTWANTGRHPLGARCVDDPKATSLANRLLADFPHIEGIKAWHTTWQQAAQEHGEELASCDLIVSAMGDWASEGALNEWHLRNGRVKPIIYGWTEPFATAGHAVAIFAEGGCLQCNVDYTGRPSLRVTEWPHTPIKQEPGCGAEYQPYGPIELEHTVCLVAELAIDCLLESATTSTHRVWACRHSLVTAAGGEWTTEWEAIAAERTFGAFVEEMPWQVSRVCPECSAAQPPFTLPSETPASLSFSAMK